MTESETVALTPTSELQTMPMTHQSRNSEYDMDADKSIVSQWDAIVKNIDAAQDVIDELGDLETTVADSIPVNLTLDYIKGTYPSFKVSVYADIDGKKRVNHEAKSPDMLILGKPKNIDEHVLEALFTCIKSPDFQRELETRNKAVKRYDDALEAKKAYVQSQFKAFEGIRIPKGYHFDGCFAYKVRTYHNIDDEGNEVTNEERVPIGNPCAITTRFRVDGNSKVMERVRFITVNGDIKDVDIEMGELSDLRSLNNFARAHGAYISNPKEFKDMLDEQFVEGVKSDKLPILDATTTIGWCGDSFVCGAECYGGNIISVNPEFHEKWYKEGTLEGYMQGIKGLVNIPVVRLAMALQVGAMILQQVGVSSFAVLVQGKSSELKTTSIKGGLSTVGNPNKIMIDFNHSNQTPNQILIGINGVMLLIDEIRNRDDIARVIILIKNISSGKNRNRFNYRKGVIESGEFSTIVCFTSEKAIFDASTYGGTRARCMVLKSNGNIPYIPNEVAEFERLVAAKATTDRTQKNFGHLGPMIYEVIMKHPDLRAEFDAIKKQFEGTTSIENRIADMQAVAALGMEILEKVFDEIRDKYPWLERMDSVQVVKDQTADYVEETTKPEWVEQLALLLSHVDCYRRNLEEEPEPEYDDNGNPIEPGKDGRVFQIKGGIHNAPRLGKMLILNVASTHEFLERKNITPRSFFEQVRDGSKLLKTNKKGLTIQNPIEDAIEGSSVYAIMLDNMNKDPWFKASDEDDEQTEEEEPIDVSAELDAINARESETLSLLKKFYMSDTKIRIAMPAKKYEEHYTENILKFVQWYESQGHTHEEAVQKSAELTSRIDLKEEQLAFYNSKKKGAKAKEWSPKIELFWRKLN